MAARRRYRSRGTRGRKHPSKGARRPPEVRGLQRIRDRNHHTSMYALSVLEDPDALEAAAQHWIGEVENAKWPRVIEWFQNYAALRGNPFPRFSWQGNTLQIEPMHLPELPEEVLTPRTVENLMIEPYQVNVSMFSEAKPRPHVTPNSEQSDDVDAASLSETLLDVVWEYPLRMPERLREVGSNLSFCGTASIETDYGDTGFFRTDEEGNTQQIQGHTARIWSAFELLFDPAARDDEDTWTWVGRSSFEDADAIEEMFKGRTAEPGETYYPERLREMGRGEPYRSPLYWWERVRDVLDNPDQMMGSHGMGHSVSRTLAPDQVVLSVLDVRPNELYPKGRTLIFAGGKLAYQGPARAWHPDYPRRWHPHSVYRYWRIAGSPWAMPLLSALRPLQQRVDVIDVLRQINREYLAIGQWLLPSACRVDVNQVSGIPGRPIPYKSNAQNAKPERVQHVPLPPEVVEERQMCVQAIRILGGVTSLAQQEVSPSANRAGVMLEALERLGKAAKSAMIQDFESRLEQTSQNILIDTSIKLRSADEDLARMLRAAARGKSQLAIRSFTGLDLRQNVHVRLDIRSELMKSPEYERETAIQWVQFAGQNMSPEERAYFIRKAGFRDFERQISPHVDRANRLLDRLIDGTLQKFVAQPEALILPVDEPSIFTEVIRSRMLEDRFQDTPMEVKQAIFGLWAAYQQMAQQQQIAQQNAAIQQQIIMALIEKGEIDKVMKLMADGEKQQQGEEKGHEPAREAA